MKRNYVRCKACHNFIEKDANFCPQCGARNKEPFYKKWWFWVIVTMLIVSFASGGESEEPERITRDTSKRDYTQSVSTTEETEPSTEATTEPVTEEYTLSSADASELVVTMIELSISDRFDYHTIEADETGITLSVATSGLAKDVVNAKYAGNDENYKPWVEAKTNFIALCDSIYDSAVEFGMKDPLITVMVLNDQNYDNIFLGITNGVVIYDVMAE